MTLGCTPTDAAPVIPRGYKSTEQSAGALGAEVDEEEMFNALPYYLRGQVTTYLMDDMLRGSRAFGFLDDDGRCAPLNPQPLPSPNVHTGKSARARTHALRWLHTCAHHPTGSGPEKLPICRLDRPWAICPSVSTCQHCCPDSKALYVWTIVSALSSWRSTVQMIDPCCVTWPCCLCFLLESNPKASLRAGSSHRQPVVPVLSERQCVKSAQQLIYCPSACGSSNKLPSFLSHSFH